MSADLEAKDAALLNPVRADFIDFPTGWAIQRRFSAYLDHNPRCSSVPGWDPISGPHFLCDCGAIEKRWASLVSEQASPDA